MSEYVYAIIFDPDGYRRFMTNKVYKTKLDAERTLATLVADYPEDYSFDGFSIFELEVSE